MKIFFMLALTQWCAAMAFSQNTVKVVIQDAGSGEALSGASIVVKGTTTGTATDLSGSATLKIIANGPQVLQFYHIGYAQRQDTLIFPLSDSTSLVVRLIRMSGDAGEELGEVTVSATRSSRTIANVPTRVELIAGEELDEKVNMKPGDIRMLLAESTGIQTQQTSATSANATIRIQGLDGKYTQMIRDGFPLYAGFSGSLGLLQIAPLDLKQVEVIKGSSSTLYGGGAIAGLVNLVSRTPTDGRQLNFLLNGTSAGGLDGSVFYGKKYKKVGTTIYAAYNHGSPYDPADIDLTAIPKFNRYTLSPKLWIYLSDRTTLNAGINATIENRIGGDLHYIEGRGSMQHSYFERDQTGRYSTQFQLDHVLNDGGRLSVKNSVGYFARTVSLPDYIFSGVQLTSYTEANYTRKGKQADWVVGINFLTDHFAEQSHSSFPLRNYTYNTVGAFVQNTVDIGEKIILETGIRGDYHNYYGFFFLPRLSALLKINRHFSTRVGGGLGYKAPTVFTEDAERTQFRNVLPIDVAGTSAEKSYGANYDVNYRTALFKGRLGLSVNQMFFYTKVAHPILLRALSNGNLSYQQPPGDLNTRGMETNIKLTYGSFKLFIGYTLADVNQYIDGVKNAYPLVARHRLNQVLMYETDDRWKVGVEAYYFSPQQLNDGSKGRGYWTTGLMIERKLRRFSLFINFENLTDTRQTRFESIYTGSITQPVFKDIYAPLDGFVANGGVKLRL